MKFLCLAIAFAIAVGLASMARADGMPPPAAPPQVVCSDVQPPCPPPRAKKKYRRQRPQLMNKSEGPIQREVHVEQKTIVHNKVVMLPTEVVWPPGNPVYRKRAAVRCPVSCPPPPPCNNRCVPPASLRCGAVPCYSPGDPPPAIRGSYGQGVPQVMAARTDDGWRNHSLGMRPQGAYPCTKPVGGVMKTGYCWP